MKTMCDEFKKFIDGVKMYKKPRFTGICIGDWCLVVKDDPDGRLKVGDRVVMGVVMGFFCIRPQMRKQKAHEAMLKALKKGDRVLTQAGFFAEVISVEDDRIVVSLGDAGKVEMARTAIVGLDAKAS